MKKSLLVKSISSEMKSSNNDFKGQGRKAKKAKVNKG